MQSKMSKASFKLKLFKIIKYYFLDALKRGNLLGFLYNAYYYGIYSDQIRIDACSICKLKCPVCYTTTGKSKKVIGRGYLQAADFRKLMKALPTFKKVELVSWGDIFLNPEIKEIMTYAKRKQIILTAKGGTTLNYMDKSIVDLIVQTFESMVVSIDGVSQKSYSKYRRCGNLREVFENLKCINAKKVGVDSKKPKMFWQFIPFGHNEHEVYRAREMARNFGMEFVLKLNHTLNYSPVNQKVRIRKLVGYATREEYKKNTGKNYLNLCVQFWVSPQINWDGKLLGCCSNIFGDYGNIFLRGFRNCVRSKKYIKAKSQLLNNKIPSLCVECSGKPSR